jgi:hypothetical protein
MTAGSKEEDIGKGTFVDGANRWNDPHAISQPAALAVKRTVDCIFRNWGLFLLSFETDRISLEKPSTQQAGFELKND